MTPKDIYNKSLINLVNSMFEEIDIKSFLTPEAKEKECGCPTMLPVLIVRSTR